MKSFTILIMAVLFSQFAIGQVDSSTIQGKITDKASKQPLMFATVAVYKHKSEVLFSGIDTDLDGNYNISNLDEGIYDIKVSYAGYGEKTVTKVKIENGKITILNIALEEGLSDCGFVFKYVEPLIRFDNTSSGRVYKAEDLRRSPIKN